MLHAEVEILELEQKIRGEVRRQMEKSQKEYYLNEQMKAIQKELGRDGENPEEIAELRKKIKAARLPKSAAEKARQELNRLKQMPMMSPEASVVRNYLEWLTELIFQFEVHGRLFRRYEVRFQDDGRLLATARGETYNPDLHPIRTTVKGATYHQLEVRRTGNGWRARVIFDL